MDKDEQREPLHRLMLVLGLGLLVEGIVGLFHDAGTRLDLAVQRAYVVGGILTLVGSLISYHRARRTPR